jgi:hypothetical protein
MPTNVNDARAESDAAGARQTTSAADSAAWSRARDGALLKKGIFAPIRSKWHELKDNFREIPFNPKANALVRSFPLFDPSQSCQVVEDLFRRATAKPGQPRTLVIGEVHGQPALLSLYHEALKQLSKLSKPVYLSEYSKEIAPSVLHDGRQALQKMKRAGGMAQYLRSISKHDADWAAMVLPPAIAEDLGIEIKFRRGRYGSDEKAMNEDFARDIVDAQRSGRNALAGMGAFHVGPVHRRITEHGGEASANFAAAVFTPDIDHKRPQGLKPLWANNIRHDFEKIPDGDHHRFAGYRLKAAMKL